MIEPAFFLGYRSITPKESSFTGTAIPERKKRCTEFMKEDLARSGLDFKDVHADVDFYNRDGAVEAAYKIPYCDKDGMPLVDQDGILYMYRTRISWSHKPLEGKGKKGKYTQPSKIIAGELATAPYIPWGLNLLEGGDILYICEGEKKTACVHKYLGFPALGIGGKDQWRSSEEDDVALHPWIAEIIQGFEQVVIVPDGYILRWDIGKSYSLLEALIGDAIGAENVKTLHPEDKIDDLIVQWRADGLDVAEQFELIPELTE